MQIPSPESRLTTDEYLRAAPDAYGDIEVVDGLVVHNVAQSEVHDLVVRRSRQPWKTPGRPAGRASASAPTWQCGSRTRRAR